MDVVSLSQFFHQDVNYESYGNQLTISNFERYFLGKSISNLVEQVVQKEDIKR